MITRGLVLLAFALATVPTLAEPSERWTHPDAAVMTDPPARPIINLPDGSVLSLDETHTLVSRDEGATWERRPLFPEDPQRYRAANEALLLRTRSGVVILAFTNLAERVWEWQPERFDASPATTLPLYVTRSHDDGQTWEPPQKLHDPWTGANRAIIQTADGAVVFTSMLLLHDPGRHATITYRSTDDGVTWRRSNVIDFGGRGHHDGALEATIAELRDGRLWMLIRTNEDRFWESWSTDGGLTWRIFRPSDIDASTAPGQLLRLASGRLALAWNRLYPEGGTTYPRLHEQQAGRTGARDPRQWSIRNPNNHRGELALSFSDDDGQTWSAPVVIAREPGARLSYPHLLERRPGELWVTTMQGALGLKLAESDFVRPERAVFTVPPAERP